MSQSISCAYSLFLAKTNEKDACFRVPQSSSLPQSCAKEKSSGVEIAMGIKCTALDQSKLSNFVQSNINDQRKDFRQENPNVESSIVIFKLIFSPSNLKDTLLKNYIYLFYLNNNIVTTKRTSASLDRATS